MISLKNRFLYIVLLLMVPVSAMCTVELEKLQMPTEQQVQKHIVLKKKRTLYRHATTAAVSASIATALYAASYVRYTAIDKAALAKSRLLDAQLSNDASGASLPTATSLAGMLQAAVQNCKLMCWDMTKFFADTSSMLVAGVVTNAVYEHVRKNLELLYAPETVLWFYEKHTRIDQLFADLKHRMIEYDLHSALLSGHVLNQEAAVNMKAFVQDMMHAMKLYGTDGEQDLGYYNYLLHELKHKYVSQAETYQDLQEQLLPHLARQKRMQQDGELVDIFERDQACRKEIVELCQKLTADIAKILAFMGTYNKQIDVRIQHVVAVYNRYITDIETQLNLSAADLETVSKNNRGMFTLTYEYEHVLKQQLSFLHKYCTVKT